MAAVHKEAGGDGWSSPVRFRSLLKTSGDILDRAQKVLVSKLRASKVLVQSSLFLSNAEMKSMIVETGVSEDYGMELKFDHRIWNLVLLVRLSIARTVLKGLIFFQVEVRMAAIDTRRA